ncbi:hypothetical protein ACVIHA_004221 [Bradyrhizobium liaoningense]
MSDQARSTVGQRQIGRAGQKRANLDLDRPGKQVPRAGTNDIGQWIINRGRLTESKNIGSLGHGVSLSSRGSGRLVTRLDTPPSSHRHHPDSAIALLGLTMVKLAVSGRDSASSVHVKAPSHVQLSTVGPNGR